MINLYKKDETTFEHNGLGSLDKNILNPEISWRDNGAFTLEFKYPLFSKHGFEIENSSIVRANDPEGSNLFFVYKITPSMGYVSVLCYQISYKLAFNSINDTNIVNKSGQNALAQMSNATQYHHSFTFSSDISTTATSRVVRKNPIEFLLDTGLDNSFVNRWGGHIVRHNFNIAMNSAYGSNKGYTIRHKKDLKGYEAEFDESTVITRIRPVGYDGLLLPEIYVDSPLIDNYTEPRIQQIEYSDVKVKQKSDDEEGFSTPELAYAELRRLANLEFSKNKVDVPSFSCKVEFVNLKDTQEYKDLKSLKQILAGDTVKVIHAEDNFNIEAQMVEYKWNPLNQSYISITLGNYTKSFASTVSKASSLQTNLSQIAQTAESAWSAANGKNTVYSLTYKPPITASSTEGDLLYLKNGDKIEMWILEKVDGKLQWVLQVSDATQEELKAQIKDAQLDIADAVKSANDAVDKANQNIKEIGELDVKLIDTKTLTDKALADVNKIASENKVLVDKAQVDATKAIDDAKTAYDKAAENSGKIVIVNQDIDKIKGEITQKVSQTDFDKSLGRINQAESSITQNANAITQKVSSIDVENILTGKAYATKSEVVQTSNSLTSTIAGVRTNIDALGTNLAYAYSADGTNGFTTVYPNLNLFKNTKTQSYTSTGTATNNSSPFYALDGITANEFSNKTIQISYDFTILNSVGTWSGTIRPTAGIGGDNQPVSNTKLTGSYVGSLRTYDVTSQAFSIIVTGLPAGTIVRIDNLKAEFGGTVKQWMPSKTEVKPSDYPSYVGRALKYSTKPSDYKWEIDSGYTDAKTDVQQTQISQMSQDLNGFKTTVSSTYLSSTDASNTYPTKDAVSGTYLNKTDASNTYPTKTTVTSQINQKADDITSSVQSWTNGKLNGYSTIQQTNDSITSTIAGVQVEIDKKANQSQVTQLSQDLSGFKTTVSNAYLSKSDASGTYADKVSVASQITQSATQVKQDLQSWTNGQLTSYSTIQSTATSIASAVASKADRTQITQLSDQITSVVESSSQNNLVYNSTLQSGSDGWVMHTGFAQSSARNINGNYIINFSLASNSDNTWYFARSKQVPVGLYKTYSYAASLMRRTDIANSGVFMLGIEGFDSTGKRIEYNTPNYAYQLTDDKWTVVSDSYTFTNPDVKTVCFTLATNGFGHYIACQPILVNDYKVGSFVPDGMDKSQITQLSTDINLRVSKGDVTSQINIEAGRTLIDTKQLLLNANTVKFSGSAFIPDAMIQNLTASKINVGTLNGANVNIINLNASNITGGTLNAIDIKGSNITSVGENYTLNQKNGSITWNRNSDGKKVFGIETQVEPSNEGNTVFEVSKKGSLSIFSKTEDVNIYKNLLTFYNNADNGITASSSVDKIFVQGTDNSASRNQTYSLTISESGISYTSSKSTRPTFNFSNFNSAISFLVGDDISSISLIGGVARVKSKYTTISGDFTVTGSKNAIHATRDGVRATPAYETAESYLGDIGSNYTRENCEVWIDIDKLFSDTVNTDIAYQVFLQAYDDAKFWVADFKSDKFLIKSDKPLSRFVWEIKAKRRGYESDRLVLQDDFDSEKIEEAWREK